MKRWKKWKEDGQRSLLTSMPLPYNNSSHFSLHFGEKKFCGFGRKSIGPTQFYFLFILSQTSIFFHISSSLFSFHFHPNKHVHTSTWGQFEIIKISFMWILSDILIQENPQKITESLYCVYLYGFVYTWISHFVFFFFFLTPKIPLHMKIFLVAIQTSSTTHMNYDILVNIYSLNYQIVTILKPYCQHICNWIFRV